MIRSALMDYIYKYCKLSSSKREELKEWISKVIPALEAIDRLPGPEGDSFCGFGDDCRMCSLAPLCKSFSLLQGISRSLLLTLREGG